AKAASPGRRCQGRPGGPLTFRACATSLIHSFAPEGWRRASGTTRAVNRRSRYGVDTVGGPQRPSDGRLGPRRPTSLTTHTTLAMTDGRPRKGVAHPEEKASYRSASVGVGVLRRSFAADIHVSLSPLIDPIPSWVGAVHLLRP